MARHRKSAKRASDKARRVMALLPMARHSVGQHLRLALARSLTPGRGPEVGALLPVRILGFEAERPVEIVTASGHVVRGLSVEGAAALLRGLA
jgi:hypothetical protein